MFAKEKKMKIEKPHYSSLIKKIWNKGNNDSLDSAKIKSERAGILLADKIMDIFDNENDSSEIMRKNIPFKKNGNNYVFSITKDFFISTLKNSIFEDDLDYDFSKEDELWRLINDVFGENGKYKNQDSFDVFKRHCEKYGFDFIKCSVINNTNNTPSVELEFNILNELSKPQIPKESSSEFKYRLDDFEKTLPESIVLKVCDALATVTEFLRNFLGEVK